MFTLHAQTRVSSVDTGGNPELRTKDFIKEFGLKIGFVRTLFSIIKYKILSLKSNLALCIRQGDDPKKERRICKICRSGLYYRQVQVRKILIKYLCDNVFFRSEIRITCASYIDKLRMIYLVYDVVIEALMIHLCIIIHNFPFESLKYFLTFPMFH